MEFVEGEFHGNWVGRCVMEGWKVGSGEWGAISSGRRDDTMFI
jgi:hypothetical protein